MSYASAYSLRRQIQRERERERLCKQISNTINEFLRELTLYCLMKHKIKIVPIIVKPDCVSISKITKSNIIYSYYVFFFSSLWWKIKKERLLWYRFFLEIFNILCPFFIIVVYHQIKTLISFWCRRRLNHKSLI